MVECVLLAVEQVPAGCAVSYGDIAELVGTIMRAVGDEVPWWRVTNAAGRWSSAAILFHGPSALSGKVMAPSGNCMMGPSAVMMAVNTGGGVRAVSMSATKAVSEACAAGI
ncbi:MAG: MGMT family protein [Propionibacteriaceae bacterium]|nr:MGMT family protein [Propionibacteriaceae bacterium]